jgi:signal transduction histidine kinase
VHIAMYSVVKYGRRMRDAYLAALVLAVGIAVEVTRHGDIRWWFQVLFYLAVCGGVWLSGYVVRTRRAYVTGLEERAATLEREREHLAQIAVAYERAAIAREMHDVVAHSLAVIIVQADGGRYAMAHDPARGRAVLETVATTARDALEEMGRLIELLRSGPDDGDEPDRDRRVWGIDRLDALVAGAHAAGVDTTLTVAEVPVADNSTLSVAVYRLVQEALTNVLRHAGPHARCAVTVSYEAEAVRVSVVDDGGSPPRPPEITGRVGHGLVGMRERVAVLGGTLTVGPRASGGWAVHANLPIGENVAVAA